MLITNRRQINRQHAEQLAMKLKFEEGLADDTRRLLKNIANDFATYYVRHDKAILSMSNFEEDLTGILREHYRRIAKTFKFNIRGDQKAEPTSHDDLAKLIDSQLVDFIQTRSKHQAGYILNTFSDKIKGNIKRVIVEGAADGVQLSNAQVADKVKKKLHDESYGDSKTVGTTETQGMAEKAKFVEAKAVNDSNVSKVDKLWKATLDEVTRIAHIFADGQSTKIDDHFIVGGEPMLHPGDDSLGASLSNIINCRCDLMYAEAGMGKSITEFLRPDLLNYKIIGECNHALR